MNLVNIEQQKIIEYLQNNPGFHTAAELAIVIGKSKRSVKNYVKFLKDDYQIVSSQKGYRFTQSFPECKKNEKAIETESISNKKNSLLNELLYSETPLNIYDLASRLYVSESVIRRNLKEIKKKIAYFNLSINSKKDFVQLEGSEQDRRHLISSMLYEEISGTFLNEDVLKKNFPQIEVPYIFKIVIENANKNGVYMNTFDLNNIVLHILISIDRGQQGYKIEKIDEKSDFKHFKGFAIEVLDQIEENLPRVRFDGSDREELMAIINSSISRENNSLDNCVSVQSKKLVNQIIEYIKDVYSIDLSQSKFLKQFGIHLDRMISRLQNKQVFHNPLAESIKTSSPTIYECAVLISHLISEKCHIDIPDAEIAFIALHIGNAVSEQIAAKSKIKVILLAPEYQENLFQISNKIERHFLDQIIIVDVVQNCSEIKDNSSDLIISLNGPVYCQMKAVNVSQFLNVKDIQKIQRSIIEVDYKLKKKQFKQDTSNFFRPEFFFYGKRPMMRNEILSKVVNDFVIHHVTTTEYFESLIKREEMSSTAFGRVAIPHSFDMVAKKSRGYVVVNPAGIQWDKENKVYLVIVLAVSQGNKKIFRDIFDKISNVMIENRNIEELLHCKNYVEFIGKLVDLIEKSG